MKTIRNVYMCLVHENQDCIIDLVRNLRFLDPHSPIILYNGGTDEQLFDGFPFARYGAHIHPSPRALKWGWLHDFAIDCMEYALDHFAFDLITVVDSDQLACGTNYPQFVSKAVHSTPRFGMFGQVASRLSSSTTIDPAITAFKEVDLWQPFLDTLPNGKEAFLHWTFWPSTAFSCAAARDLVHLFRHNLVLQDLLQQTRIWASEEVLLPTLTVALGYRILQNPCSYEYVKYRVPYTAKDIERAVSCEDYFWIHPVNRHIGDRNRIQVRTAFHNYVSGSGIGEVSSIERLTADIASQTAPIPGWLSADELKLLIAICADIMSKKDAPLLVETGSYCGKATVTMALAAKALNPNARIVAIDDFSGRLGAEDTRIDHYPPSFATFSQHLQRCGVSDLVEVVKGTARETAFSEQVDLLLIDGLHDYANVAHDFFRFEDQLSDNGCVLFHDYGTHFPGVTAFVQDLLLQGYVRSDQASSLVCLAPTEVQPPSQPTLPTVPRVSCIMPTYNRHGFLSQAIAQFLAQDYPNKELIIIDDSEVSCLPLVPQHADIRYVHLPVRNPIGSKRNKACELAKGSIIVHLDDDDFYAPDWLRTQVDFLLQHQLEVTGLKTPLFRHSDTNEHWQYTYPDNEKPWVYGATLCYTRAFWQSNHFPEISCGEDNQFVWAQTGVKLRAHKGVEGYLGRIHDGNTSKKELRNRRWGKVVMEG